jgi:DNA-binding PadR family transcriptional regulator
MRTLETHDPRRCRGHERGDHGFERGRGRGGWPGDRGHRGRPGHGGRARGGRGDVRAAILLQLDQEPLHGYQLMHRIEESSGGLWRPSPGSVYPALKMLEDEGLVRPDEADGRRVFTLTDAGTAYVTAHREELQTARDAVLEGVNPRVQELRDVIHQLTIAAEQVAEVGTPSQIDAAQNALVETRRQLYRILADDLIAEDATTSTKGGDAHD